MNRFMFSMSPLKYSCLVTIMSIVPALAYADSTSFDTAVNEYLKGFRACSEANTLRSTNVIAANKKFAYYQRQLDLAVSIDESILTSDVRDMDKNIAYCQRVEDNLKRAKATPILEHAFTYCETAKSAFKKAQYKPARQEFEKYRRLKEDAYAITQSLNDVFVLTSKIRSCARFEDKLASKEKETLKHREALQQSVVTLQEFKQECDKTLTYVTRSKFGIHHLATANKMLNTATKIKKRALNRKVALDYAASHPDDSVSIQFKTLQESTRICEGGVNAGIRNVAKQKRAVLAKITQQTNHLKKSLLLCQAAQSHARTANLKKATDSYNASASLKKNATQPETIALIKTYAKWKTTAEYNEQLSATKDCQVQVATSIKILQKIATQAEPSNATDETPTKTPAGKDSATTLNTPFPEDKPLEKLEDWNDSEFSDDEFAPPTESGHDTITGRRSWTNLIR